MKTSRTVLLLALTLSVSAFAGEIPDLVQTDPKGNFARGGKSYCGPVAVSNSLMALLGQKWKGSQYDLVNRIASEEFMNTHPVSGTGPNGIMRGVRAFLIDEGYEDKTFEISFQGWRSHAAEFSTGKKTVNPEGIAEALASGGAAWLNVGWYRKDGESDDYVRVGGHWVTAVESRPTSMIIHDPAPRTGLEPRAQVVTLKRLARGALKGKTRNLPQPAAGTIEMGGDMVVKSTADCALIDGAVTLRFTGAKTEKER